MKRCFKCGEHKPPTDFYAARGMAEGVMGKCKECAKSDVRQNRRLHLDCFRAYDRKRAKTMKRRLDRAERCKRRRASHPSEAACRDAVQRAVRAGRLSKADLCGYCGGGIGALHAHHVRYDWPLAVVWLCAACHSGVHHRRELAG